MKKDCTEKKEGLNPRESSGMQPPARPRNGKTKGEGKKGRLEENSKAQGQKCSKFGLEVGSRRKECRAKSSMSQTV